jgi:hypothetical protein
MLHQPWYLSLRRPTADPTDALKSLAALLDRIAIETPRKLVQRILISDQIHPAPQLESEEEVIEP